MNHKSMLVQFGSLRHSYPNPKHLSTLKYGIYRDFIDLPQTFELIYVNAQSGDWINLKDQSHFSQILKLSQHTTSPIIIKLLPTNDFPTDEVLNTPNNEDKYIPQTISVQTDEDSESNKTSQVVNRQIELKSEIEKQIDEQIKRKINPKIPYLIDFAYHSIKSNLSMFATEQ